MISGLDKIQIEIRAGIHTGECDFRGNDQSGIAVHVAARKPSTIWVSDTVKQLVTGSTIQFKEEGIEQLKGMPGEWKIYSVEEAS